MNHQRKQMQHVCHCSSYRFPHRMGGGDCKAWHDDVLCEACGQPAELTTVDYGIGAYEFWGIPGVHRDVHTVTVCCEAGTVDNVRSRSEWFPDKEPFESKTPA
jgi:hypothetical protein